MNRNITDVENFWQDNPLFDKESYYKLGSKDYFKAHNEIVIRDCFGGEVDKNLLPKNIKNKNILDLGCGAGFWVEQLIKLEPKNITAVDITKKAIELTKKRVKILDLKLSKNQITYFKGNAEELEFEDNSFDYVNCQGVIHHTPNTQKALHEIIRVLKPGGTLSVSVYYKNFLVKFWPYISFIGIILTKLGAKLKGRGREKIFSISNSKEIVRYYDGANNPIGKAYSKKELIKMFTKDVSSIKTFYHFFPARALNLKLPRIIHKFLDRKIPFMIYVTATKIKY